MRLRLFSLVALSSLCLPLAAQSANYTGTYTTPTDAGAMTLVLQQDAQGNVLGAVSGNGSTFRVEGALEDDAIVGAFFMADVGLWFEAELDGQELFVFLMESDANGNPNYDTGQELVFTRQSRTADVSNVPRRPAWASQDVRPGTSVGPQPASGSANPLAQPGGTADPYVGTFSDGNLQLDLQRGTDGYSGRLRFNGQTFPVVVQDAGNGLSGSFQANGSQFPLTLISAGNGVSLTTAGQTYSLARQGSGQGQNPLGQGNATPQNPMASPAPGAAQAGPVDNSPLAQEWTAFLRGKKVTYMDSYSSGGAGGYSTRIDVYLCTSGEFLYKDQSSVSVDVGGASGFSGGNSSETGRWRVITQGQLAGVELRYNDGKVEQYQFEYRDSATYVNGTRVYVTPAEICP